MNEKFSKLGFYPSDILLPKKDVDMSKWAVVACDQFTSEPEYWERVEKTVGDAPSTLRLILPAVSYTHLDVYKRQRARSAASARARAYRERLRERSRVRRKASVPLL